MVIALGLALGPINWLFMGIAWVKAGATMSLKK